MTPWIFALLIAATASTPTPEPPHDVRIDLITLQLHRQFPQALELTRDHIRAQPEEANRLGLHYLEGHLLDLLDRPQEASTAFANALTGPLALRPHVRMRLASIHDRLGHPEVAAGLMASLLGSQETPRNLLSPAAHLLRQFVDAGGDCRLVDELVQRRLPEAAAREVLLSRARCAVAGDRPEEARSLLFSILQDRRSDEVALRAATMLVESGMIPEGVSGLPRLIGLTFHAHREFELASRYLALAIREGSIRSSDTLFETRYSLARSKFWLAKYESAARQYHELAQRSGRAVQRAQSRFQEARCYELTKRWKEAAATYLKAQEEDPHGPWSGAALMAALRVAQLTHDQDGVLDLLELLGTRNSWRNHRARAALFLAVTEIAGERLASADEWLTLASRGGHIPDIEIAYWRGRKAILENANEIAVHELTKSLIAAPYHPIAQAARRDLGSEQLASTKLRIGTKLSWSHDTDDLQKAWLLLGGSHRRGRAAFEELSERWQRNPKAEELRSFQPIPPADWPLWSRTMSRGDEMLLALGIIREATSAVPRLFPVSQPLLGLTGSHLLAQAGQTRGSLYQAEILRKRYPKGIPEAFLSRDIQRLEYPLAYAYILLREGREHGISPHLLAAIVREESRFDPKALSGAAARGLAQFTLQTAREVSLQIGISPLSSDDLHKPEVSLALGAAYLARLEKQFPGHQEMVVAAYNAGEAQARLWREYCVSEDPAEYFTKVGFRETRGYLRKVFSSRAHYDELYPETTTLPAPRKE